jgi:hypothetical protein
MVKTIYLTREISAPCQTQELSWDLIEDLARARKRRGVKYSDICNSRVKNFTLKTT